MRPFPPPCLAGVTVLLPFAIRPMTGSVETFCFLGARSPLGSGLFAEGLLDPVLIATSSVFFLFAALFLMDALLFASSISEKKMDKFTETIKLGVEDDGLTMTGALLVLDCRRSGFRSVTIPMDGVEVYKLRPHSLLWFGL